MESWTHAALSPARARPAQPTATRASATGARAAAGLASREKNRAHDMWRTPEFVKKNKIK